MLRQTRCCTGPRSVAARCRDSTRLRVRASVNGSSGAGLSDGAKVRVLRPIRVFHVPKRPDGVQLEGLEGIVLKDETVYKGKVLSVNLPYKVEFVLKQGEDQVKFAAHLAEDELQLV